ncbi:MAG TPA: NADPH-dependent FMN reductase [Arenimonas sp.]|nr:NADPH-dependent FMN reductase [Arenimonas sp.]
MSTLKLAVIVGSARRESINRRLAQALIGLAGTRAAADIIRIDDLPLFNQDLEAERPAAVERFAQAMRSADAVLIVTPEHNRSIPALLKNAIDWGSRPKAHSVWAGKVVAITGASPGAIGTALAQQHLRQILGTLGSVVPGGESYISFKPDLIDANDHINDEGSRVRLQAFVDGFLDLAERLHPASA